MLDALSKSFFHTLAGSRSLKRLASSYGMRRRESFARRFIAGETLDEALIVARELEAKGLTVTLDQLGESVSSLDAARSATHGYIALIEQVIRAGIAHNLSLKLTQLGLDLDRNATRDNLRRILDAASAAAFFVRIDMESSPYVDHTLDIWESLWTSGYRHVGIVLQSALFRSEQDLRRVMAAGGRVRLVKGAYNEPADVAYRAKSDVDAAYVRMAKELLQHSEYPAIATHDEHLIDTIRAFAASAQIAPSRYEFQMLYGIRRDLQNALVATGYGMRIYVPFGKEWFPYFMRRLGERPANVAFVLRGILQER
ncbi:MAG: proline dehydrogenase family protein [Vicinamibacterales bacterium]